MTRLDRLLVVLTVAMLIAGVWVALVNAVPRDEVTQRRTHYRIDVNTANADDLSLLPGIGPGLAQRIIDRRESVGPFTASEQVDQVKGIGPKTMAKIRPYMTTDAVVHAASVVVAKD